MKNISLLVNQIVLLLILKCVVVKRLAEALNLGGPVLNRVFAQLKNDY